MQTTKTTYCVLSCYQQDTNIGKKCELFCGAIQYRFTVYINKTMTHAGHVCEHIHVNTGQHV